MPEPQMAQLDQDECRRLLAEIADPAHLARLPALPCTPGPWRRPGTCVRPLAITGRRITIVDDLPFTWWG